MTRPALTAFLDAPEATANEQPDVGQVATELAAVLAAVIEDVGFDRATDETALEPARLRALRDQSAASRTAPVEGLTLSDAASILSLETPLSAAEVRGRLRDDLLVAMSREPVDLRTLTRRFDLGEPATLRAKIEGEKPLSLREYARLRVVLPSTRG
jgi:hypothetical protein